MRKFPFEPRSEMQGGVRLAPSGQREMGRWATVLVHALPVLQVSAHASHLSAIQSETPINLQGCTGESITTRRTTLAVDAATVAARVERRRPCDTSTAGEVSAAGDLGE